MVEPQRQKNSYPESILQHYLKLSEHYLEDEVR